MNGLPFIDFGFCGPRKLVVARQNRRVELSPPVRARANNFQVCKQYILEGLGIGAMPTQIICTAAAGRQHRARASGLDADPLDVHMIYPFGLSFSTLISAFYEIACEIIVENTARA